MSIKKLNLNRFLKKKKRTDDIGWRLSLVGTSHTIMYLKKMNLIDIGLYKEENHERLSDKSKGAKNKRTLTCFVRSSFSKRLYVFYISPG